MARQARTPIDPERMATEQPALRESMHGSLNWPAHWSAQREAAKPSLWQRFRWWFS